MKIAITITTFKRPDGRTPEFILRTLDSVKGQSHTDYKVYLIGDKYEDHEEFLTFTKCIDTDKIYYENLGYAAERDIYLNDAEKLWCSGGVNATNYAISRAISDGYEYICHLDHDDCWLSNHLEEISNFIENNNGYDFIATKTNYLGLYTVPKFANANSDYFPIAGDITHSATCVNFVKVNLRYRDVFKETGVVYPADADLWKRITDYMIDNKQKGYLLDKTTVIYDKPEKK